MSFGYFYRYFDASSSNLLNKCILVMIAHKILSYLNQNLNQFSTIDRIELRTNVGSEQVDLRDFDQLTRIIEFDRLDISTNYTVFDRQSQAANINVSFSFGSMFIQSGSRLSINTAKLHQSGNPEYLMGIIDLVLTKLEE